MYISPEMRSVCFQRQRRIHIKIELLDFAFRVVDELSGIAVGAPGVEEDCESDIRRTCSVEMIIKDSSFDVQPGGKIWLDKYIRLYQGIEDSRDNNKIVWFNMGIYLINEPSYTYDAETKSLYFEGVDLMAKLTGLRNGQLSGVEYQIPAGSSIKEVVTDTIAEAGFDRYIITIRDGEDEVPYDMSFDVGSYVYDILAELRDLYVTYQIYFDVDGVFHFEPIPTGDDLPSILSAEDTNKLITSYNLDVSFENVKNYIEVYGMTYEADFYAEAMKAYSSNVTRSGNVYTINLTTVPTLEDADVIGGYFTDIDMEGSIEIKLGDGQAYPVLIADYETEAHFKASDTGYYMFEWNEEHSCYLFYYGWGLYISGNNYSIISSLDIELIDGDVVGMVMPQVITNPNIVLNGSDPIPIRDDTRSEYAVIPEPNEYYVVGWDETANCFYFIGYVQPRAIAYDDDPRSPFYIGGTIGIIRLVCSGGEYDNISTNQLAQDRAEYELYNYCRLQDTISIEMLPVPYLSTYDLIDIKLPEHTEVKQYIIKNISTDLSVDGMQEIEAYQYYPYFIE